MGLRGPRRGVAGHEKKLWTHAKSMQPTDLMLRSLVPEIWNGTEQGDENLPTA